MAPSNESDPLDVVGVVTGMLVGRRDDVRESGLVLTILEDEGRVVHAALPRAAADKVLPEHVGMRVSVMVLLGVATQVVVQVWP